MKGDVSEKFRYQVKQNLEYPAKNCQIFLFWDYDSYLDEMNLNYERYIIQHISFLWDLSINYILLIAKLYRINLFMNNYIALRMDDVGTSSKKFNVYSKYPFVIRYF